MSETGEIDRQPQHRVKKKVLIKRRCFGEKKEKKGRFGCLKTSSKDLDEQLSLKMARLVLPWAGGEEEEQEQTKKGKETSKLKAAREGDEILAPNQSCQY